MNGFCLGLNWYAYTNLKSDLISDSGESDLETKAKSGIYRVIPEYLLFIYSQSRNHGFNTSQRRLVSHRRQPVINQLKRLSNNLSAIPTLGIRFEWNRVDGFLDDESVATCRIQSRQQCLIMDEVNLTCGTEITIEDRNNFEISDR
jgi:hypothetical protein